MSVIERNPQVLDGAVVFSGTRVPFHTLLDYLQAGQPLAELLNDYPTVTKEQAIAALQEAEEALLRNARSAG